MRRAAAAITIAVIDTGADLTAPDLSSEDAPDVQRPRPGRPTSRHERPRHVRRRPRGRLVDERRRDRRRRRRRGADDRSGRRPGGAFTDVDEAAAIVYAVDHGARSSTSASAARRPRRSSGARSSTRSAKGVLLVAAVGNGYLRGNAVEYPAALLQPLGSNGVGGHGLSVAASDAAGQPGALLQHRLACLARRAGRRRLQRRLLGVAAVSATRAPQLPGSRRGRLRLRQRHVVRGAAGRGRGGARLGGEPAAAARTRSRRSSSRRRRARALERRARLRRPRRRGAPSAQAQATPATALRGCRTAALRFGCGCTASRIGTRVALRWRASGEAASVPRVRPRTTVVPSACSRLRRPGVARPTPFAGGAYRFTVAALRRRRPGARGLGALERRACRAPAASAAQVSTRSIAAPSARRRSSIRS